MQTPKIQMPKEHRKQCSTDCLFWRTRLNQLFLKLHCDEQTREVRFPEHADELHAGATVRDSVTSSFASGHEFLPPPHQHQQPCSHAMAWSSSNFPREKKRRRKISFSNQLSKWSCSVWCTPRPRGHQGWPWKGAELETTRETCRAGTLCSH